MKLTKAQKTMLREILHDRHAQENPFVPSRTLTALIDKGLVEESGYGRSFPGTQLNGVQLTKAGDEALRGMGEVQ